MASDDQCSLDDFYLDIDLFEISHRNSSSWLEEYVRMTNELSTWEHEEVRAG